MAMATYIWLWPVLPRPNARASALAPASASAPARTLAAPHESPAGVSVSAGVGTRDATSGTPLSLPFRLALRVSFLLLLAHLAEFGLLRRAHLQVELGLRLPLLLLKVGGLLLLFGVPLRLLLVPHLGLGLWVEG